MRRRARPAAVRERLRVRARAPRGLSLQTRDPGLRERTARIRWSILGSVIVLMLGPTACTSPSPTEPPLTPATTKGHQEVVVLGDGSLAPLILDTGRSFGLCYPTDPSVDTTTWTLEILFDGEPAQEGARAATERSDVALCFKGTPPESWAKALEEKKRALPADSPGVQTSVCGRLSDELSQTERDAGCVQAFVRADDIYQELITHRRELLQSSWDQPIRVLLPKLDDLASKLESHRFPQLRLNVEMTAVHFLSRDGSAASLEEAQRRLDHLPPWLGQPFSEHTSATALYQKGMFLRDSGARPADSWAALKEAETLYGRIARPRLYTTHAMAQIVAATGAVNEAQERLRTALAECEPLPPGTESRCNEALEANARATLAWMTLLDGSSRKSELKAAERFLTEALDSSDGWDPLEVANRRLDLAYLGLRLGEDVDPSLRAADEILNRDSTYASDGARNLHLSRWRDLIAGLTAVRDQRSNRAVELCTPLAGGDDPLIAAWAASCIGRAQRQLGRTQAAADSFRRALARHELLLDWEMGRKLPLGLDQRADDFSRAARTEIELGRPDAAWDLLRRLDRLSVTEAARRRCRQANLSPEAREQWQQLDREAADIYETLSSFAGPASLDRRQDQERLARDLKARLRELWRQWPGCQAPTDAPDAGLDYRAFALEDEILLLHRTDDGSIRLARRTSIDRSDLLDSLEQLTAMAPLGTDEQAWRRAASPLAVALLPESPLPAAVTYALHGALQAVPMVALPLDTVGNPGAWLGQRTSVALQTAGAFARDHGPGTDENKESALFVIDPSGNLTAARRQGAEFESLFPQARVLQGAEATREQVLSRLSRAEWIHFDTHGSYDPAMPELSSLILAEGPIHWLELTGLAPEAAFVNLSGCQTGRWPVTADSGAYGIAGLFTRLGTPWAVGSRVDLADRVAVSLNQAFYQAIHKGESPLEAFRSGIDQVSAEFPAPQWSGWMLLRAAATGDPINDKRRPSPPEQGP